MKILVFGLSSQRGGVESVILNFCMEALERALCSFDFVVIDEIPTFAEPLIRRGCQFYVVPSRLRSYRGYRAALRNIVESGAYDAVWYNVCTLSDITLLKIARNVGVPTVLHAHNSENMGNVLNALLHEKHKKEVSKCTDAFLACSQDAARFIFPEEVLSDSENWFLVKNAIPLDQFQFSQASRDAIRTHYDLQGCKVIGNVGRLHPQKNHSKILDVFTDFYRDNSDARLVLIGDGPLEKQIRYEIEQRGLDEVVLMLGAVENVRDWLSAFDVFLFPSLYEGLPLALLEAQASGLPCVISDAVSEMAICSKDIRRVEVDDSNKEWASAISDFFSVSETSARIRGLSNVKQGGFDITLETPRLIEIFSLAMDRTA